jgi:hypothetical protein
MPRLLGARGDETEAYVLLYKGKRKRTDKRIEILGFTYFLNGSD